MALQDQNERSKLIFDASSAYILIKEKNLRGLENSRTLDLAFYEIGNSIIKEQRRGIIDERTTRAAGEVVKNLPEIMMVANFREMKADEIFEIAQKSHLTYFDASYIALAKISKEILVTDDTPLATAAQKMGIRVYSSGNFENRG